MKLSTDAVQGVGHFPLDLEEIKLIFYQQLRINFMDQKELAFPLSKKCGLNPFIVGGGQNVDCVRTESVPTLWDGKSP